MSDADILRAAAMILRRRSRKPLSFSLRVVCRVLEIAAVKVENSP